MEYKELEVDSEDSFIVKELILAYKEHIKTLESEVRRLRMKYEPTSLELASSQIHEKFSPPTRLPRLTTMTQVIQELEKRTAIKAGVVSDEEVKS